MGGCKCSYKSCNLTTDGVTHFFHYPVKDEARCQAWIKHSKRSDYNQLSTSQLKNKVICQNHFTDEMFLNYKHDRLIHKAVPTIEYYKGSQPSAKVTITAVSSPAEETETPKKYLIEKYPTEEKTDKIINKKSGNASSPPPKAKIFVVRQNSFSPKTKAVPIKHHSTPIVAPCVELDPKNTSLSSIDESTIVKDVTMVDNGNNDKRISSETMQITVEGENKDTINFSVKIGENMLGNISDSQVTESQNDETVVSKKLVANPFSQLETQTESPNPKGLVIHSNVVVPEKSRINFVNLKNRNLTRFKPGNLTKVIKPKLSNANNKLIIDLHKTNLSLPSVVQPELVISSTPTKKKSTMSSVALIDEQLRRLNRDKVIKNRFIKLEGSMCPAKSKEESQDIDYVGLLLKTREEIADLKKVLQKPPVVSAEQASAMPTLSKEVLFASIVPYLSAELSKKVHEEMFPSLVIKR